MTTASTSLRSVRPSAPPSAAVNASNGSTMSTVASASASEWAERFHAILVSVGWPGERTLNSAEHQTLGKFQDVLAEFGLRLSGVSPDGGLVEVIELPEHPWFLGCQFHPELKSRPTRPHPLFVGFIGAALERRRRTAAPATAEELAAASR